MASRPENVLAPSELGAFSVRACETEISPSGPTSRFACSHRSSRWRDNRAIRMAVRVRYLGRPRNLTGGRRLTETPSHGRSSPCSSDLPKLSRPGKQDDTDADVLSLGRDRAAVRVQHFTRKSMFGYRESAWTRSVKLARKPGWLVK